MENIWLYFFSALMQTTASLIALFSVFVVFKIDKINNKLELIRSLIIKVFISIKNNEDTPGTENKKNKEFCNKYNIHKDKNTYEKYSDTEILNMLKEYWGDRTNFLGVKTQFGNDLITEESLKIFQTIISDKKTIFHRLIVNITITSLLIALSIIFLIVPSEWRLSYFIYLSAIYAFIVIAYNVFSTIFIIKI